MDYFVIPTLAFTGLVILIGGWLGWQLLRQNGRILLRLDELEKRLNELEFGGADEPEGLPVGSDAPAFELPDLADERKSLAQFRGQSVLLIFFNPDCGFCRELMPKLAALAPHPIGRGERGRSPGEGTPRLLILATGDAKKNRQFFAGHKAACPVLLQNDGEVAKAYRANGTPTGYLVGADGKIASEHAIGAEALLRLANGDPGLKSESPNPKSEINQSLVTSAATNGDGRANRFSQHSLARSKIKRDGLKAGTPAPDFRLPRLDGRGNLALSELRGKHVLLVFSSPHCGPCNVLAPELEKFHRATCEVGRVTPCAPGDATSQNGAQGTARPTVVMVSRGEPKENRAKVKEHGLTFPVVLQQHWEISRRYAMFATPIAYLIDEQGIIAHDVAVGVEPILGLLSFEAGAERPTDEAAANLTGRLPQAVPL
jgi:peroxiredoxin